VEKLFSLLNAIVAKTTEAGERFAIPSRQYFTAILPFVYDLRSWPRLLCGS
jgi:hypothetical protein